MQNNLLLYKKNTTFAAPIHELRVDGGATRDNFLMQFQADISDRRVIRPVVRESTALGAAFLAGLASGFWQSKDELLALRAVDKTFEPSIDADKRTELYNGWNDAVGRTLTK